MSGFLDRMAARAQGAQVTGTPAVHLRPRARFEPAPGRPPVDPGTDRDPMAADRRQPHGRQPRRATSSRLGTAAAAADTDTGTGLEVVRDVDRPPEPGTGSTPSVLAETSGPRTRRTATFSNRRSPAGPDTGPGDRKPLPAVAVPDPLAVVRDRVVPMLVEAGVLGAGEEVEIVDAAASAQAPGSAGVRRGAQLRVDPSHQSRRDRAGAEPRAAYSPGRAPDVHVHIGRIEVVRAPAPPSPPPARRGAPVVDHAGYLARRQERR